MATKSRRILVQAMTEEWLYEFETADAALTTGKGDKKRTRPAKRITNLGRAPWNIVNIDVTAVEVSQFGQPQA